MTKTNPQFFLLSCIFFISLLTACQKDEPVQPQNAFVPTDVLVTTKKGTNISKIFSLINSVEHDVEYMYSDDLHTTLPSDSLAYMKAYFAPQPYANKDWPLAGLYNYNTNTLNFHARLFNMHKQTNQQAWLQTITDLKLTESGNDPYFIHFHVPEGKEKEWIDWFMKISFVESAELNAISYMNW